MCRSRGGAHRRRRGERARNRPDQHPARRALGYDAGGRCPGNQPGYRACRRRYPPAALVPGANCCQGELVELFDRRSLRCCQGHSRSDHAQSRAALSGLRVAYQRRICDAGTRRGDSPLRRELDTIGDPLRQSAWRSPERCCCRCSPRSNRARRRLSCCKLRGSAPRPRAARPFSSRLAARARRAGRPGSTTRPHRPAPP